jgi:Caspase domain.
MRIKLFPSIVLFFIITHTANSQSIYQLKYNLLNGKAITSYTAFFVRNDDGTGVIRIKSTPPVNGEIILSEMDVQENYPDMTSNDKLFYKLTNPRSIKGVDKENPEQLFIWFKKNPANNEYEPAGVTKDSDTSMNIFTSVDFLDSSKLKKELVLEYFTNQDIFYKNLFETRTRDLSPIEKNTKLILLVVANINEPEIGASCLKDMNRIVETFTKLTNFLGIKFQYKTISGAEYNKENAEKEISNITPAANDIVVFYYTGHGFRKPKDSRRFPYIDLRPKPDITYMVNSLNMEDVYETIRKKGARLNLILSDCCNTEVTSKNAIGTPIPNKKGLLMTYSLENCRSLFLNPKPTSILATAADVGQKASSNNDFGGFFSYFFKASMENQLSFFKKNVTWESLLLDAKKQTIIKAEHTYCDSPYVAENICEQYPVWK